MTSFTLSLAGVPICVNALFPDTERFCRDYLTSEPSAITVTVSQSDIDVERDKSAQEDMQAGVPVRCFSDIYLETLAVYRKIVHALLPYDILLFHGAVVAVGHRAWVFTAPSGTGKTTHTRLWLKNIPGAYVVNGDKPLLKLTQQGILACGTPWQGKENYGEKVQVPLQGIVLLERSPVNRMTPMSFSEMLPTLLQQIYRPARTEELQKTLDLVGVLGQRMKLYRLSCNMEDEAAWTAYHVLTGGQEAQK